MNNLRTAAQQALEALENERYVSQYTHIVDAITALRAALAEPVQEPVASVTECEACFTPDVCQLRGTCDHYAAERLRVAAPPQREPVQEAVAKVALMTTGGNAGLATALRAALAEIESFNPDWDRVEALQESLREHMAEISRLRAALAEPVSKAQPLRKHMELSK